MTTIQQVRSAARKIGVIVEYDRSLGRLEGIAPTGCVFRENGCHYLPRHFERGPWVADVLDDFLMDLNEGLEPCADPDCDICNEQLNDC